MGEQRGGESVKREREGEGEVEVEVEIAPAAAQIFQATNMSRSSIW
jgi:hypothetical protein